MTFKKYRSLQTVYAARITAVNGNVLHYENETFPLDVDDEWLRDYDPSPGDYIVKDEDSERLYVFCPATIDKHYEEIDGFNTVVVDDPSVGAVFARMVAVILSSITLTSIYQYGKL